MGKEIVDQVLARLDVLAAKLGTTGEYLWGVLVKQARVEAMVMLFVAGVGGVMVVSGILSMRKGLGVPRKTNGDWDDWAYGWFIPGVIVVVFGVIMLLVSTGSAITPWLNPEYWALRKVMEAFR